MPQAKPRKAQPRWNDNQWALVPETQSEIYFKIKSVDDQKVIVELAKDSQRKIVILFKAAAQRMKQLSWAMNKIRQAAQEWDDSV
jgi:hypothetical protein